MTTVEPSLGDGSKGALLSASLNGRQSWNPTLAQTARKDGAPAWRDAGATSLRADEGVRPYACAFPLCYHSGHLPMRIRRRLPIFFGVLLVAAAVALAVFLRKHAPPEPARLLPSADAFAYVNLKWIRRADIVGQLPAVSHDPDYEQFIQATGFEFERDLDQAALAIHYPSSLPPQTAGPPTPRFSEVFVGKIDGVRLRAYLHKLATTVETDGSVEIYDIPLEGRTLRVAILGPDTVAASNHPDPQVIRGIVERSRKLASPFGGPALLRQYYKHVPLSGLPLAPSLVWGIFRINPPGNLDVPRSPTDVSALFSQPAVVVASARYYLGNVHLRGEAFTGSVEEAKHVSEELGTFLSLFHTAETSVAGQGSDPDVKQFFDSLKVEQHSERAVVTAVMPPGFLHKAVAESPKELETQPPPVNPARK